MLTEVAQAAAAGVACAVAVALATGPARAWLLRIGVHDTPNARSSHAGVKPRGGGLAVVGVLLPAWLLAGWLTAAPPPLSLVALTALLAGVSFVDDVRGVPVGARLAAQAAAVGAGLVALAPGPILPDLLPVWLERGVIALAWLWFVNLYNFMDGIDGITAVETGSVGLGLGLVWLALGAGGGGVLLPWLLAGAAAGFLWWNWAPAKIFLGDVGSVPLGFALGWLLLDLAANGALAAALILPGYYLVDASLTLILRLSRGEKVWRAHREHAYQRAVRRGRSHAAVAARVGAVNAVLVGCALWSVPGQPAPAVALAAAAVSALWLSLRFGGGDAARAR